MGLLQPEAGLLFWMTLAFAVVFILLAKFGFPVILRSIDSRKEFIDSSLDAAREAERKLVGLRAEGDAILEKAARERTELLREAAATREQLLREARRKADEEGERIVAAAVRRPRPNARPSCRMPVIRWRCFRLPSPKRYCVRNSTTSRRRRGLPRRCSTKWNGGKPRRRLKPCIPD